MKKKFVVLMLVAVMAAAASADITVPNATDVWTDSDAATAIADLETENLYTVSGTGTWVSGPGAWAPLGATVTGTQTVSGQFWAPSSSTGGWLEVGLFETVGGVLTYSGGTIQESGSYNLEYPSWGTAGWVDFSSDVTPGVTADAVFLGHGSYDNSGNDYVRFRNVSVTPEPVTIALLGMGALMIRRKRK